MGLFGSIFSVRYRLLLEKKKVCLLGETNNNLKRILTYRSLKIFLGSFIIFAKFSLLSNYYNFNLFKSYLLLLNQENKLNLEIIAWYNSEMAWRHL